MKPSDWAVTRQNLKSEKLATPDPNYRLHQETYSADRCNDLEEQTERLEAKRSIQEKLKANRQQYGRAEPT